MFADERKSRGVMIETNRLPMLHTVAGLATILLNVACKLPGVRILMAGRTRKIFPMKFHDCLAPDRRVDVTAITRNRSVRSFQWKS